RRAVRQGQDPRGWPRHPRDVSLSGEEAGRVEGRVGYLQGARDHSGGGSLPPDGSVQLPAGRQEVGGRTRQQNGSRPFGRELFCCASRPKRTPSTKAKITKNPAPGAGFSSGVIYDGYAIAFLFCRFLTRSSTTVGSANVVVSPRLPGSSSAILRRMR